VTQVIRESLVDGVANDSGAAIGRQPAIHPGSYGNQESYVGHDNRCVRQSSESAFESMSPEIMLTTVGSMSVVTSPSERFSATSRKSRRMIFPERVLGNSGVRMI